ncbi:MAG TPA: hypothetical protein VGJ92_12305 [Methanocella sp.]
MNAPALSSIFLLLTSACLVPTLAFLYLISRFYELKFGQHTHYRIFLAAAAAYALLFIVALLGYYTYELLTAANGLALLVLFACGLRLYRLMTGVTK